MVDEEKEKRRQRRLRRKAARAQQTAEAVTPEVVRADCIVCGKSIKPGQHFRKLPPDARSPEWRYYHSDTCGPGTKAWFEFHPSPISKVMMESKSTVKEKRTERRLRRLKRKGGGISPAEVGVTKPLIKTQTKTQEDITMAKKEETAKKKGEHLKPMQPVIVPASVVKQQSKDVQALLKQLSALERSSKDAAKIRKSLRKLGFKLSEFREGNGKEAATPKKGKKAKAAPPEEDED